MLENSGYGWLFHGTRVLRVVCVVDPPKGLNGSVTGGSFLSKPDLATAPVGVMRVNQREAPDWFFPSAEVAAPGRQRWYCRSRKATAKISSRKEVGQARRRVLFPMPPR